MISNHSLYIQIWFIIQLKQPFINGWPWGSMMLYAAYSKCACRPKIPSANLRFERTSQSPIFHVKKQVVYTGRDGRKVHLTVHMFFFCFFIFFLCFFLNSILESTIVEAWFFDPIITSKSSKCSPAFSLLRYG